MLTGFSFFFVSFFVFAAGLDDAYHQVLSFLNGCLFEVISDGKLFALSDKEARLVNIRNGNVVWSAPAHAAGCRSGLSLSNSSICSASNCWALGNGDSFFDRAHSPWPPQIDGVGQFLVSMDGMTSRVDNVIEIFESRRTIGTPFRAINVSRLVSQDIDVVRGFMNVNMNESVLIWGQAQDFLIGRPLKSLLSVDIRDVSFGKGGYGGGWGEPRYGGHLIWQFPGVDRCQQPLLLDNKIILFLAKLLSNPSAYLYALSPQTGHVLWSAGVTESFDPLRTTVVLRPGRAVVLDGANAICFSIESGRRLWTARLPGDTSSCVVSPTVSDFLAVFVNSLHELVWIDVRSGLVVRGSKISGDSPITWIVDDLPSVSPNSSVTLHFANVSGVYSVKNVSKPFDLPVWTAPPTPMTASPSPVPTPVSNHASPSRHLGTPSMAPGVKSSTVGPPSHDVSFFTTTSSSTGGGKVTTGRRSPSHEPLILFNLTPVWIVLAVGAVIAIGCAVVFLLAWRRRQRKLKGDDNGNVENRRARSGSWVERLTASVSSRIHSNSAARQHQDHVQVELADAEKLTLREQLLRDAQQGAGSLSDRSATDCPGLATVFAAYGIPHRGQQPCVLATLGDESQVPPGLVHFLFPNQSIAVSEYAGRQLNACVPDLLFPIDERPFDTFYVVLTAADEDTGARVTTYGIASLQTLPVGWKPLSNLRDASQALRQSPDVASATVCFVLLSRFPYFAIHTDVLNQWVETERKLALAVVSAADGKGIDEPFGFLQAYREARLPRPGNFVFQCPAADFVTKFHLPSVNAETELLARLSLPVLMAVCKPGVVVRLLTHVLLEHKVAVVCEQSLGLCGLLPLALLALLAPFGYQGTFISLVPRSLLELLSAPVPFLVGVPVPGASEAACAGRKGRSARGRWFKRPSHESQLTGAVDPFPGDVVAAVVVDNRPSGSLALVLDEGTASNCPRLPGGAKLEACLSPLFDKMRRLVDQERDQRNDPSWLPFRTGTTSKMLPIVEAVCVEVSDVLHGLVAEFRAHCVRNTTNPESPVTAFVRDTFVQHRPVDEHPFFSELVATQSFACFEEQRLRFIDNLL